MTSVPGLSLYMYLSQAPSPLRSQHFGWIKPWIYRLLLRGLPRFVPSITLARLPSLSQDSIHHLSSSPSQMTFIHSKRVILYLFLFQTIRINLFVFPSQSEFEQFEKFYLNQAPQRIELHRYILINQCLKMSQPGLFSFRSDPITIEQKTLLASAGVE